MPEKHQDATIVSILPFALRETKNGMHPNEYKIPAADPGDFAILHVEVAMSRAYIDEDRGFMEKAVFASDLAESITSDYNRSMIGLDEDAMPGLSWLPGKLSKDEIRKHHGQFLKHLEARQTNWFRSLVKLADDDWSKFHLHSMITDIQRLAAERLGLRRDWLVAIKLEGQVCVACKTPLITGSIVCPQCRTVQDQEAYKKLQQAS